MMLQPMIGRRHIHVRVSEQAPRRRDTIRPNDHAATGRSGNKNRLVPDLRRVAARFDSLRPDRVFTPVTAADYADSNAARHQLPSKPDYTGCLSRTADSDVADDNDGNRQSRHRFQTDAIAYLAHSHDGPIDTAQRPQ